MAFFCTVCGNKQEEGQRFCSVCGTPFINPGDTPAAEAPEAPAPAGNVTSGDMPGTATGFEAPKADIPATPIPTYAEPAQPFYQPVQQPGQPSVIMMPPADIPAKPKRKKLGFGRRTLAFLLCILLFALEIVAMVFYSGKASVSKKNINKVLGSDSFAELDLSALLDSGEDSAVTLSAYIYDMIPDEQKDAYPDITEENIEEILENRAIRNALASAIGDITDYFVGENDKLELDADKVIDLLEENEELIEELTGKTMQKSDYKDIRKEIEEFNEDELQDIVEDLEDSEAAKVMKALRFILSKTGMLILCGAIALFALMIFLSCGRFVDVSLSHIGMTTLLAGGSIVTLIKLFENQVMELLEDEIDGSLVELIRLVFLDKLSTTGLFVAIAGAVVFVGGTVWKFIRKSRA